MNNVIQLRLPRRQTQADRLRGLTSSFAHFRRSSEDVYWLKENAELLNILETTRPDLPIDLLTPYESDYAALPERLAFFPQYYRFLLGLCLDLEDLGMPGQHGDALCAQVKAAGFAEAELSDLQRAEARRLMARRIDLPQDQGLDDRLRAFAARSQTFALPNKKAAYELTHIVFYLSEYGRRDPMLDQNAVVSLEYAGLLAYLDQNADLLAEVCVALRFAGQTPSPIWEDWLARGSSEFTLLDDGSASLADDYHDYLVTNWWSCVAKGAGFADAIPDGRMTFHRHIQTAGALRPMSELLYHLGSARSADWERMRSMVSDAVGSEQNSVLLTAEQSSPRFGAFFEGFARAVV